MDEVRELEAIDFSLADRNCSLHTHRGILKQKTTLVLSSLLIVKSVALPEQVQSSVSVCADTASK
jgi:hypothetical protein